ncbi:MAG: DUF427 domain-containing protein [Rhodobacterales bacterium]|nr:DUF427 domain-containing protein [Rhodobacterales bacterium]
MCALAIENVQSYPRPPLLDRVAEMLRLVIGGAVVAETAEGWRVCETHHPPTYYFPPGAIAEGLLQPVAGRSFCEWKGAAIYFDLAWGDLRLRRAAWAYPAPTPGFRAIAGHVAFYVSDQVQGFVGEVQARPQPGGFYGGWVTPNLTGTIKGSPGTEGW